MIFIDDKKCITSRKKYQNKANRTANTYQDLTEPHVEFVPVRNGTLVEQVERLLMIVTVWTEDHQDVGGLTTIFVLVLGVHSAIQNQCVHSIGRLYIPNY